MGNNVIALYVGKDMTTHMSLLKNGISVLTVGVTTEVIQMTKQEAIDLLDNLIGMIEDNHGSDYDSAIRMAIDALEPQWIPCSERLPDVAQRVLLSGHGEVMIGRLHSFGKYSLEPTGISYIYPKDAIEAWMPLPNPYKEEEE